jgi:hypothetical protein
MAERVRVATTVVPTVPQTLAPARALRMAERIPVATTVVPTAASDHLGEYK